MSAANKGPAPVRRGLCAVLVGLCASLVVSAQAPAFAGAPSLASPATPPSLDSPSLSVVSARSARGGAQAAGAQQIDCFGSIDDPTEASLAGRVNVLARVRCSRRVPRLMLRVSLYDADRSNRRIYQGSPAAFVRGTASLPCVPGRYFATAGITVVFPPGYEPSPQRFDVRSRRVTFDCR